MKKLSRGRELISANGVVLGARLERNIKGEKKIGNWSWFDNPFVGTRELSGLKVMMALMNNWDLLERNNSIYEVRGVEYRYVVSDLGSTFGKTGNEYGRSKGDLEDYIKSKFIERIGSHYLDFALHTRPIFFLIVNVLYYQEHARME